MARPRDAFAPSLGKQTPDDAKKSTVNNTAVITFKVNEYVCEIVPREKDVNYSDRYFMLNLLGQTAIHHYGFLGSELAKIGWVASIKSDEAYKSNLFKAFLYPGLTKELEAYIKILQKNGTALIPPLDFPSRDTVKKALAKEQPAAKKSPDGSLTNPDAKTPQEKKQADMREVFRFLNRKEISEARAALKKHYDEKNPDALFLRGLLTMVNDGNNLAPAKRLPFAKICFTKAFNLFLTSACLEHRPLLLTDEHQSSLTTAIRLLIVPERKPPENMTSDMLLDKLSRLVKEDKDLTQIGDAFDVLCSMKYPTNAAAVYPQLAEKFLEYSKKDIVEAEKFLRRAIFLGPQQVNLWEELLERNPQPAEYLIWKILVICSGGFEARITSFEHQRHYPKALLCLDGAISLYKERKNDQKVAEYTKRKNEIAQKIQPPSAPPISSPQPAERKSKTADAVKVEDKHALTKSANQDLEVLFVAGAVDLALHKKNQANQTFRRILTTFVDTHMPVPECLQSRKKQLTIFRCLLNYPTLEAPSDLPAVERKQQLQAALRRAEELEKKNDFRAAGQAYDLALTFKKPDDLASYKKKFKNYARMLCPSDLFDAEKYLIRALFLDPFDITIWFEINYLANHIKDTLPAEDNEIAPEITNRCHVYSLVVKTILLTTADEFNLLINHYKECLTPESELFLTACYQMAIAVYEKRGEREKCQRYQTEYQAYLNQQKASSTPNSTPAASAPGEKTDKQKQRAEHNKKQKERKAAKKAAEETAAKAAEAERERVEKENADALKKVEEERKQKADAEAKKAAAEKTVRDEEKRKKAEENRLKEEEAAKKRKEEKEARKKAEEEQARKIALDKAENKRSNTEKSAMEKTDKESKKFSTTLNTKSAAEEKTVKETVDSIIITIETNEAKRQFDYEEEKRKTIIIVNQTVRFVLEKAFAKIQQNAACTAMQKADRESRIYRESLIAKQKADDESRHLRLSTSFARILQKTADLKTGNDQSVRTVFIDAKHHPVLHSMGSKMMEFQKNLPHPIRIVGNLARSVILNEKTNMKSDNDSLTLSTHEDVVKATTRILAVEKCSLSHKQTAIPKKYSILECYAPEFEFKSRLCHSQTPSYLAESLDRDFRRNTVQLEFMEMKKGLAVRIFDPTGYGIQDIEHNRLVFCCDSNPDDDIGVDPEADAHIRHTLISNPMLILRLFYYSVRDGAAISLKYEALIKAVMLQEGKKLFLNMDDQLLDWANKIKALPRELDFFSLVETFMAGGDSLVDLLPNKTANMIRESQQPIVGAMRSSLLRPLRVRA